MTKQNYKVITFRSFFTINYATMNYILIKKDLLYIKNSSYIFRFCNILNNIDFLIHLLDVHY